MRGVGRLPVRLITILRMVEVVTVEGNKKITDALITLLESGSGYKISFFGGLLSLRQLEDGRFSVNRIDLDAETGKENWIFEEIFVDAREAAKFFERKRREYRLGFEIERELNQS